MKYLYMNEQERQMQYYQFPKFLLELQLSQNARIIYMLLYDRARISRKNNWTDEDGRVYAIFPIEELSQKTGKCKSSVKKALKELDDAGLLIRKFGGFSKPRHMHVMIPDKVEISRKAQLQTDIKKADIELKNELSYGRNDNSTKDINTAYLQDNCGRFRVRHFGVATAGRFSSFAILKQIRDIVRRNRDIKVWNLSLGSAMEIDSNFISPEAAELDKIQYEYDVIFVIAGTNKKRNSKVNKIGAPADSLNSLVVNAVDFSGNSASYTRRGPVLSFFYKPDVCYYGGDGPDKIVVCEPLGKATVTGTSFAAPWITRKMAYLIHVMGLSREVAKALIIDSAAGWNRQDNIKYEKGYGIVPKKIEDILYSRDDEIRFIMSGNIDEYEVYTYNIPVPQKMNAHPFFAKATLAYFPQSDRNQGVDYTSTEMDIHFGRIKGQDEKAVIKAIDYNKQAEEGLNTIYEEDARKLYRKWDNVKHISEALKENGRPRKVYQSGLWGLSIKTKERLDPKAGRGLRFGIVVTLREMNGENRIDDFIKMCMMRGWIVNRLDVQAQADVYFKAEEEITFE